MSSRLRLLRLGAAAIALAFVVVVWRMGVTGQRHLLVSALATYGLLWLAAALALAARAEVLAERFVLTSAGLAVGWGLLEGAGRVGLVDYRSLLVPPTTAWERPENVYHPEMRFVRRPHLVAAGESLGNLADSWRLDTAPYPYEVRYDARGFRNAEDMSSAELVVLGDSYIESPLVPDRDILTSVLARIGEVSVANVAVAGWGPGEELGALKSIVPGLRPRVVVWAFFEGNDPENLASYVSWTERGRPPPRTPDRWSLARSVATRVVEGGRPTNPLAASSSGVFRTGDGREVLMYFSRPPRTDLDEGWFFERLRPVLQVADSTVQDLNARLVFVFVPLKFRVYHDLAAIPRGSPVREWRVGNLPDQMRSWLASVAPGITFLDATVPLRAAARAGELVYLLDDTHWSAAGHRVVAEALAPLIEGLETP
jgi:hypothetical protein